jgi:hypothetical protein
MPDGSQGLQYTVASRVAVDDKAVGFHRVSVFPKSEAQLNHHLAIPAGSSVVVEADLRNRAITMPDGAVHRRLHLVQRMSFSVWRPAVRPHPELWCLRTA